MKKCLLSACCFLCLVQSTLGQVNQELENKYWTYRDRYRNYFTKIGGEAGESQSAASINQLSAKSLKFKIKNKQEVATGQENNYLMAVDYADAVIDQGWYMMVLASEYWLLKNKNQMHTDAYKALCNELYFAINAIERLDGNAEPIFKPSYPPNLNGFFVRSDHQPDYLNGLNKVNVPLNPIQWLKSGGMTGPEFSFIDSSNGLRVYDQDSFRIDINNTNNRCSWQGGPGQLGSHQNWGNEMSQDQLYGLLMGFKSIMNWVDADLTVDPDGALTRFPNKNLHQWIKTITHRIMLHVSKTHKGLFGVADQDDLKADAEDACATITNKPYYRADTTGSDTLVTYIRDSTNNQIIDSIIDIVYFVKDTAAAAWFPGSKFRTCDVWQKLEELKAGNYLFKEANYIITNPANGDNLVTRGAVATPFAYALKSLGESITGNTYPEPFMKLRDNYQVYRWGLNAAWVAKMIAIYTASGATTGWSAAKITRWNQFVALSSKMPAVLTALNIAIPIALSLKDDWEKALDIYNAVTSGCPMAAPSPDLYAFCILQHSLNFKGSGMYKALWDRFPESNILKVGTFETIPLNLMNNLAVASGKWSHQTYADWCTYHGFSDGWSLRNEVK